MFGTLYFITSLKGGFGLKLIYDSQALAANTLRGYALVGVAFLLSQLLTTLLWPAADSGRPPAQ